MTSIDGQDVADAGLAAPVPVPAEGRVQLALNVDSLDEAVAFYSHLLGTAPAKLRPGYANFSVASPPLKLVLLEDPGRGGTLNHLGVEVRDSATVSAAAARLSAEGLLTAEEVGTTCCFATQDKVWVTGPAGERWEVYTVLADSEGAGAGPMSGADPVVGADAQDGTGGADGTDGDAGPECACCDTARCC